ncbi:cutinase [Thermomonospora umbrina]|uniref:Poly(ethylene terephthalate) hydrolase n=1 Tax=Thermomonospora umbrina TaxID=111806 RepID=A0A3D9SP59_9ACTN|nr:cutinase [Thermomonospora umbrina]
MATAALTAAMVTAVSPAQADANPYQRGPEPTEQSVTAERGPFATSTVGVPAGSGTGFNRGTIYYPTDTSQGTFGAIAVIPGFTGPESSIAWFGPHLASHGFVVMTLTTSSGWDFPASRTNQLLAALDYLTGKSAVRDRIDATRLGVMGHSMGGGGSLGAAAKRPAIQAAVPLTPWHLDKTWNEVRVPTMIIGAEADTTASVGSHSERFYASLTNASDRAYLELESAGHLVPISYTPTIAKYSLSWLKRFVDNDTRYDRFLCPAPQPSSLISEYRDTCPHS